MLSWQSWMWRNTWKPLPWALVWNRLPPSQGRFQRLLLWQHKRRRRQVGGRARRAAASSATLPAAPQPSRRRSRGHSRGWCSSDWGAAQWQRRRRHSSGMHAPQQLRLEREPGSAAALASVASCD